ncbi:hypothetical protein LINPERPRIM_LOCUS7119 [Linum perenne]
MRSRILTELSLKDLGWSVTTMLFQRFGAPILSLVSPKSTQFGCGSGYLVYH